jgi:Na+-transporting NADH:ubiquinone oxidoreductase subunit A
MEKIKITKGFNQKLVGAPNLSIIQAQVPKTVGVSALDIPYIRPKLLVKENDLVQTGTPLFYDKRDKSIQYLSPGTGKVILIRYGDRRRLLEVVIELEKYDNPIKFKPILQHELKHQTRKELAKHLKTGGLWQCLRQLPFNDTANENHKPKIIIVSLNSNDIFSPDPGLMVKNKLEQFEYGLEILKLFSPSIVVTSRQSSLRRLGDIKKHITHIVQDTYPAWNPSIVLYHIKKKSDENSAWYVELDHLIKMAQFLLTGHYPVEKLVTVSQPQVTTPHILTRQGAPISSFVNLNDSDNLITTGQFNGRQVFLNDHLGFFENTLNILKNAGGDKMFGFAHPGFNTPTVSNTFISRILNRHLEVDCTLHGEERACINCSYCEDICPNDIMPNFIMKSLYSDEIEEALELGLLDCSKCGLCSYACPSKIELKEILSKGIDAYYKDRT